MQRYTLDLSEHFSDQRGKIFVRRKQHWSRVHCLLDHVRRTFQIQPECYLTNEEDILFPEAEDLDVIQETDRIRVRVSNSCGTQPKCAPTRVAVEARVQNGKRKHVSTSSGSSSSSDSDDEIETLPKIFSAVEKVLRDDEEKPEVKPKRKRVRKRKSKKKVEETPPPKVVVKTYGKTKAPPIVIGNGDSGGHVRFDESDKEDEEVKVEPYRNLNRTVTPRVVMAVPVENGQTWNDDIPAVPEYDVGAVETKKSNSKNKSSKKSVKIKQETIEAATRQQRDSSPTWDDEPEVQPKETFIANYSGVEFYESLKSSIENFPSIALPSANDVIACGVAGESYLAFVESVVDGDDGGNDATKLTLRRLNCNSAASAEATTLNQLTEIRLVATYQP